MVRVVSRINVPALASFFAASVTAVGLTAVVLAGGLIGCDAARPGDGAGSGAETGGASVGTVGLELQLAPGVTVSSVAWTIANAGSGFSRSGTVNVQFANTISFQVGGVPAGAGYTLNVTAMSVGGALACTGSATFSVTAGASTPVAVTLFCAPAAANGTGTVVVSGSTQICANVDSLSVSPLETTVNNPIALAATASAATVTPTFAWTATAGTFDNPASATPTFTCPPTPGPVTITVSVSPAAAGCTTATSQSVVVTCDTLNPTFTNVYTNVIGARCTGCHRPGGSGVNAGLLDLSTPSAAYVGLVNMPGAGIGAGASGITCASLSPPMIRVAPGNAAASLLFNKVASKLSATPAACGSPMPLPAAGAPLTAAQVDLIAAWINAGALND